MKPLIPYLQTYNPAPTYAQAANRGVWEEAVRMDSSSGETPDISALGEIDPSIAAEIFYDLNDGRTAFFGLKYSDTFSRVSTPEDFLNVFTETLKVVSNCSVEEMLEELGARLTGDKATFLSAAIGYVELGVQDFWKSAGSKILRKVGEPQLSREEVRSLLADNPRLLKNNDNYIALEFSVPQPICWFGVRVSQKNGDSYVTDLDMLTELVNKI